MNPNMDGMALMKKPLMIDFLTYSMKKYYHKLQERRIEMDVAVSAICVAVITGACSIISTLITASKQRKELKSSNETILYRIDQLEKKQDKHNSIIERTFILEGDVKRLQAELDSERDEIKEVKHDIHDIKN